MASEEIYDIKIFMGGDNVFNFYEVPLDAAEKLRAAIRLKSWWGYTEEKGHPAITIQHLINTAEAKAVRINRAVDWK